MRDITVMVSSSFISSYHFVQATGTPYPQPYMLEQPSNRMPVTNPAMPSAFNAYRGAPASLSLGQTYGAPRGQGLALAFLTSRLAVSVSDSPVSCLLLSLIVNAKPLLDCVPAMCRRAPLAKERHSPSAPSGCPQATSHEHAAPGR